MQSNLPTDKPLDEIPRMQRPQAKPIAYYLNEYAHDPHTGMAVAYLIGDYTMKTIAGSFGCITRQ
jgi:putative transposase